MVHDSIIVILKGILYFFCNPVLYFLIAGFFLFGWQRVRRERRSFGLKVYGVFNSVMAMVVPSLLMGLIGTIILVGVGIALPIGIIALITICYFLTFCTVQLRFLSPIIAVGLTLIIAYFLPDFSTPIGFLNQWLADIRNASLRDIGIVLTLVTLLEAVSVLIWGGRQTSPRLINSNRGKKVGAHEAYQLWIAPIFLLIPATNGFDAISWWPFSSGQSFGLYLLPMGIGFQQLISHSLPLPAIRQSGRWLLGTAILVGILTGVSFFYFTNGCLLAAAAIAVLSRLALILRHYRAHHVYPFFFTNKGNGLMVVGIIPNSPADHMNIKIGEIVDKANGRQVRSEEEFYQALQINAAYCKLDILNYEEEVRFVKGPVYENDFHNIGFLFLEPSRRVMEKAK
ncbi:cell division topological determinant MinJ [Pullulanibacillus camelliae]|uniref:Cell division topological determinant MinJ n=1 Tax=Pullulanibacillus camelliae TaxID=1707096 RepID=A0A8J2YG28_9BACL|nr:PDZ domain-containing protein [Pullulanibacillus camelliae]GGE36462.1 cell division topological determinant MinJ [Pullulanibacillus camelliae]